MAQTYVMIDEFNCNQHFSWFYEHSDDDQLDCHYVNHSEGDMLDMTYVNFNARRTTVEISLETTVDAVDAN